MKKEFETVYPFYKRILAFLSMFNELAYCQNAGHGSLGNLNMRLIEILSLLNKDYTARIPPLSKNATNREVLEYFNNYFSLEIKEIRSTTELDEFTQEILDFIDSKLNDNLYKMKFPN